MLETMGNEFVPNCSEVVLDEAVGGRSMYYRLGESEIFTYANQHTKVNGLALIDVIPRMVCSDQGFVRVYPNMLDKNTEYELFESTRFKMTCRRTIKDMLENGNVVMVYSETYRVHTAIPFIAQIDKAKNCTVYVNITDFVEMNQYGQFEVKVVRNYNALMSAIVAACLAQKIITMNSAMPADIADCMVLMYSAMFENVINKMIHMDPIMRDKIRYLATEFCLVQMYGTQEGLAKFQRYQTYFPKLSKMIMDSIDNSFDENAFDKLTLFIEELKKQYPSLKGLTMYNVYEKWVRSYGAATAMSIDYIGYHLYTMVMILLESPLITRTVLEPMMEKNKGMDMYKRIQQILM